MNKVKEFSCLIKPVSGRCNLNCTYCFYCDEMRNREIADRGVMSDETMHNLIKSAMETNAESITFTFQGGEPTLAGLDFYSEFVDVVNRINDNQNNNVKYTLQSNGLLIDEEWADFFAENNFLIGLSIDGYRTVHDKNRGEGSWKAVKNAAALLRNSGVEYTGLCVVTDELAINAELAYTTMKNCGFDVMQFIPCIAPLDGDNQSVPTARQYGRFLIDLYRLWTTDIQSGRRISIRYFENLIAIRNGGIPESCGMSGKCCNQNVVEADGSVYPCDFYVLDEYYLGNINDVGFDEINDNYKELASVDKVSCVSDLKLENIQSEITKISGKYTPNFSALPKSCLSCDYFNLCRGGCRREQDNTGINRWCEAYKMLFNKIL